MCGRLQWQPSFIGFDENLIAVKKMQKTRNIMLAKIHNNTLQNITHITYFGIPSALMNHKSTNYKRYLHITTSAARRLRPSMNIHYLEFSKPFFRTEAAFWMTDKTSSRSQEPNPALM